MKGGSTNGGQAAFIGYMGGSSIFGGAGAAPGNSAGSVGGAYGGGAGGSAGANGVAGAAGVVIIEY
jgi:hypothetical protein